MQVSDRLLCLPGAMSGSNQAEPRFAARRGGDGFRGELDGFARVPDEVDGGQRKADGLVLWCQTLGTLQPSQRVVEPALRKGCGSRSERFSGPERRFETPLFRGGRTIGQWLATRFGSLVSVPGGGNAARSARTSWTPCASARSNQVRASAGSFGPARPRAR